MNCIVTRSRIASDGTLTIQLHPEDAGQEVQVTIRNLEKSKLTQEEWKNWVRSMAGSLQGPFEIDYEGDFEVRDELQ